MTPFRALLLFTVGLIALMVAVPAAHSQSARPRGLRPDGSIAYQWLTAETATELTISVGVVTVTQASHTLDGEGDLSDDLATINGGVAGRFLLLRPANVARDITLKHGTGNIQLPDASDVVIPDTSTVLMFFDGTNWLMVGRAQTTGGETNLAANLGAGVGVWETKVGSTLNFNSLVGASGITIAEDDPSDELDISVSLATDPGLEFSGGDLRALVDPSGGLERVTAGLDVKATGIDAARLADEAVTLAKMAHVSTDTLLGRVTASSGDVESLSSTSLTEDGTPSAGEFLIGFTGTALRKYDISNLPAGTGEANTASNVGAGVGTFDGKSALDLQFRSLIAANGMAVTLDGPNKEIDLAVSLAADPGLEFSATDLRVLVDPSGGLERVTAGLDVKDAGITTVRVADEAVTLAKLAHVATNSILGRVTATTGDPEVLTSASVTLDATPVSGEFLLGWTGTALRRYDIGSLPTAGGGEVNTASNLGAGVGVFSAKSGFDLQFNSLVAADGMSVTLDAINKEVDIAVSLATDPGLEFSATDLRVLVDPAGALERVAAGLDVKASGIDAARIADEAVTLAKQAHIATDSILGRVTASSGDVQVLTSATVTLDATPASGEFLLGWTGTNLRRYDIGNLPSGSGGNVAGAASSTDNAITRFDGTTGKTIQNSSATLDDNGRITASWTNVGVPAAILLVTSGDLAITGQFITVQAKTGTTDNMESISGGSAGDVVYLIADTGDTITIEHASSNIRTTDGTNFVLNDQGIVQLIRIGSNWHIVH